MILNAEQVGFTEIQQQRPAKFAKLDVQVAMVGLQTNVNLAMLVYFTSANDAWPAVALDILETRI